MVTGITVGLCPSLVYCELLSQYMYILMHLLSQYWVSTLGLGDQCRYLITKL